MDLFPGFDLLEIQFPIKYSASLQCRLTFPESLVWRLIHMRWLSAGVGEEKSVCRGAFLWLPLQLQFRLREEGGSLIPCKESERRNGAIHGGSYSHIIYTYPKK